MCALASMLFFRICVIAAVALCLILLLVPINAKPFAQTQNDEQKCGYQSCNKARPDALNVHLVPHSHDDVGWLKTVDEYFYGTKANIQRADVNRIISSVVAALNENPERRFIQVETAFFHQWWTQQNDAKKEEVKRLVQNGQLEFAGGAWSMNDEAAVHYQSVVDQFTFALKFLNNTFGECGRPKIGWQIDPFGHSSEMASIFAQMSYDGVFFARLDWRDKMSRLRYRNAEMIWQGSKKLGNASNIFTSTLYNHYSAPVGFCFDTLCSEDPIVTDKQSTEYNFLSKVQEFTSHIMGQAYNYKTDNILIPMGDDFNYQDALTYYRNMDTLIEGFKKWPQQIRGREVNVFYSTPACYVKAVNDAVNSKKIDLPLETNDFFPYANDPHAYWSGYYSSRPTSKRMEKSCNNLLQVHKQLAAFTHASADDFFEMQKAVGIMQHHDAITGTEKQHVADDYARIMNDALHNSGDKINTYIAKLLSKDQDNPVELNLKQCLLRNESICDESRKSDFSVVIYNPLATKVRYPVRLPSNQAFYEVTGPNNEKIPYQIGPSLTYDRHVRGSSEYELTFIAHLNPLSLKVFHIHQIPNTLLALVIDERRIKYTLTTPKTSVQFTPDGLLSSVMINGLNLKVKQELLYYKSAQGNNSVFEDRSSGAYIFRPMSETVAENMTNQVTLTTYRGHIFDEVHQEFGDWAKQSIRVYYDELLGDHIEIDWVVGPIPVDDLRGKEVISRFTTELNSGKDFFTDSNGREMMHRIRDFRPTFRYTDEEPIAGNYYPVTVQMAISDGERQASVLNDRSQGGSSLQSGEMELMLHRRMLNDDAFGVGEALNEESNGKGLKVSGRHYFTVTDSNSRIVKRRLANRISLEPWIFLSGERLTNINEEFTGLTDNISENVKLLTLEPVPGEKNTLLIRLENFLDEKEVTVDLTNKFKVFDILSLEETNLAGNVLKASEDRLKWNQYPNNDDSRPKDNSLEVRLKPFEIKTFIALVFYK